MNYQLDFSGKNILITGANGGLGRAIAKGFAGLGGNLILADLCTDGLEEIAAESENKCLIVQADLNNQDDIDRIDDTIKKEFGRLDVLMNNAGIGFRSPSVDVTKQQWDKLLNINLDAPFFLSTRIASEFMIPQKSGKIVNTASMGGFTGIPASTAYSASKGAVLQITRSLATEWAPYNIQVNAICPGYVRTGLIKKAMENEDWMKLLRLRTPAGRIGEPEDIVGAAFFLASDLAGYITGTYIQVDGGAYAAGF